MDGFFSGISGNESVMDRLMRHKTHELEDYFK